MTPTEVKNLREIMTSEILQREGLSTAKLWDVILINQNILHCMTRRLKKGKVLENDKR